MRRNTVNCAARLDDLKRAGCPTLPNVVLDPDLRVNVELVGGVHDSMVFDLGLGTGYIMDLVITSGFSYPLYLDLEGQLPWGPDRHFRWLSEGERTKYKYRIPGSNLLYPRDVTLNDWLSRGARLGPHGRQSGILLGWGGPLPDTCKHGKLVSTTFVVYDHCGNYWSYELWLSIDRSRQFELRRPKTVETWRGLYEPIDQPGAIDGSDLPIGNRCTVSAGLDPNARLVHRNPGDARNRISSNGNVGLK